MRNLGEVIDRICKVAPDLNEHFKSLETSIRYSPPEMMREHWFRAAEILNTHAANHPKSEKIGAIFSAKE